MQQATPKIPAHRPPEARPADLHVLIVDDEPRLRDLLGAAVRKWGFTAEAARSGEEALRLADRREPDVLILDLNLPGLGGLECLSRLRISGCDAAAIVLTGFGDLDAARRAFTLDVVEFLSKPCPLGDLEKALDRARRRSDRPSAQPDSVAPDVTVATPPESAVRLDEIERQHILQALTRNGGNRTVTAVELGISRRTLQYRLSEYQRHGWSEEER